MSRQKTALFLQRPERQNSPEREWRSPQQQKENTERFVRQKQQQAVRLDHPGSLTTSCCFMGRYWLEGGTFWESQSNTTHGAWSESLISSQTAAELLQHWSERLAHTSITARHRKIWRGSKEGLKKKVSAVFITAFTINTLKKKKQTLPQILDVNVNQ